MRKLIFILMLALSASAAVQAQWSWSGLIHADGGHTADFDIDPETGYLHIVTMKAGVGVDYTILDEDGRVISRTPVPGTGSDTGGWKWGASIDVDSDGYPHILYRRENTTNVYTVFYIYRNAAGWSSPMLVSDKLERGNTVRIALDKDNRVFIAQGYATSAASVPYGRANFFRIVNGNKQLRAGNLPGHRTESRVEIDASLLGGEVHMLLGYPDAANSSISYYRSIDHGNTMQFIKDIHASQCTGRNAHPDVFVDKLGNVHICYGAQKDEARNGNPSVRYVLYKGNYMIRNTPATGYADLKQWKNGEGWGLGSVAASDSGEFIVVAFLDKDIGELYETPGELYATLSMDEGVNWEEKVHLEGFVGGFEGRNIQLVRANKNNFYVIYPYKDGTALRVLKGVGDVAPVARSGGPYQGNEGQIIVLNSSGSSDSGKNPGIVEYAWDFEGDGTFDVISALSQITYIFEDDFQGQAVLRVTDKVGHTDYDTTSITILNVAPAVQGAVTGAALEGNSLTFSSAINEPGDEDTVVIAWSFNGSFVSDQTGFSHLFRDDGIFSVVVTVTDDDGGVGSDTLTVTVQNVPPVVDIGGPFRIGVGEPTRFEGEASDPGVDDTLTYRWNMDENGSFELEGRVVVHSFPVLGQYTIVLEVDDGDGGLGYDSTLVIVGNAPPVISMIPGQTIMEGGIFQPVNLDDFVADPDQTDENLIWTYSGNHDLLVGIQNRILTAAVPDSEWSGTEILTLIVSDPLEEKDTTQVQFKVMPVNDPPLWLSIPDYTMNEDDTLRIPLSFLRSSVVDVDDDSLDLSFSISANTRIHAQIDPVRQTMLLFATPNWYGEEVILFIVKDKANASDEIHSKVTVNSVPDAPLPFTLIDPLDAQWQAWPDTVLFHWHWAIDPDVGESVFFIWEMLGYPSEGSIFRTRFVSDTILVFIPDRNLVDGIYYWWVTAEGPNGERTTSTNSGIIIIGNVGVDQPVSRAIPADFNLLQNYPNPFNPETWVVFHLPKAAQVRLSVYNALGQTVKVLALGNHPAGVHRVRWDGRDDLGRKAPSGLYICRMEAGGRIFYMKMVMVE